MNPAEEYILRQDQPYRDILLQLQVIVESSIPNAQMLFKYKIPFYYLDGKQPFCYMMRSKDYVDLCFWHGTHLTRHLDKLIGEKRKHMKSLRFFSVEDVDVRTIQEVLEEAYSYRERKYYK